MWELILEPVVYIYSALALSETVNIDTKVDKLFYKVNLYLVGGHT